MHDETSPTIYRFAMNVPDGGHTTINPDGSATVYDRDGNAIRQVARPWAFDAAGRPQKTWYTVDENGDLVQHIEPADNALYPILADPADMCTPEDMNADGVPDAQANAPAPAPQPAQPQPDQPQSNSDAMGDLLMPSFDESAPPESSEPEFNQYNPLTYPDTTGGGDGQAQPDQSRSDALGDLVDPSFDESATPESSEPEFNQYNPLTYPDTSQSGDGQAQPDQSQPDQSQSDALGELLMPSFSKEPQPDGRVDAPAAGQSMTYGEWLQYTHNQRLDGRVHERVAEGGTVSYYDLSRGPDGEQIERPVTGFGTALENETVYNFGDGTGKTGTGQPAVQDTNGNWWIINKPGPAGEISRTGMVDGKKITITTHQRPDGTYTETTNGGMIRHFDQQGNLLGEDTLDPGTVVGDSSLSEAILSVAIPGGWLGRAGKLAWSLLRKNPEAKKPPRQGTAPRPNAKQGSTERHTSIHETRPEYGTSLPEVLGRGTGGGKKALDQASKISTRLTNKGSPHTTQPVPGPSMTPMPQPGYQYGDIIVGGAIIFAGLVKVFSRMASRWRWPW
ncbi:hypothetical protein L5I01_20955 [Gordonia sp. HY442]|uniref:hypothetical protein n=1 Tax=Gordonia zhenghanii TaxID=2911516 RepID=UPI001F3F8730|nr:hypothetical protein [Gordonia zhenghanii]MCF8605828.1 hypothetical protein [Gordonia zhenghanii]